ncbi:MAG: hypothetical protein SGCHY_004460 [Lobulomycetales sp.]
MRSNGRVGSIQETASPSKGKESTALQLGDSPSTLAWHSVSFSVPVSTRTKGGKKTTAEKSLVKDLNGSIQQGEMIAILGGSGAGKSTLLNAISGRLNNGTLSGSVLLNGQEREEESWRKLCSYVEQDDILYENLTVYETLLYSARLRLPSSLGLPRMQERVEEVISQLGLESCRDTRIGSRDKRGISGGERKRVSIGIELVTDPGIIFMDEPSSGLDAFNALNTIEIVKSLVVARRKMVLMTIHQPRTDILELFDKIILLSAGRIVFFGCLEDAISHFESLGYPLPPRVNPSDYFLDVITLDQRNDEKKQESLQRIEMFTQAWINLEKSRNSIADPLADQIPVEADQSLIARSEAKWPSTWFNEFLTLLERNLKDEVRNPETLGATIGQGIVILLLMGGLFWQLGIYMSSFHVFPGYGQDSIQNRIGVIFFIIVNQSMGTVMPTIAVFPTQRQIIRRERASNSYRASSAFLSKFVSSIPLTVVSCLILCVPVYWMIGLQANLQKYCLFVGVILAHSVIMSSLGLAIGSAVPTVRIGQIIGPLIVVVFLLFAGNLLNLETLPVALKWLQYISPIGYESFLS